MRAVVALALLGLVVLPFEQEAKLVTIALAIALATLLVRVRPARL